MKDVKEMKVDQISFRNFGKRRKGRKCGCEIFFV